MKFLALLFLGVLPALAKDIRDIRFPFAEEKEMTAFITETEPQLSGELQQRVWRNGLKWMREESDRKRVSFWQWLRGMRADDAIRLGYITHCAMLSDEIEALAKEAREKNGEEAARLKARAAKLSKARDAISAEVTDALNPPRDFPAGTVVHPEPPR